MSKRGHVPHRRCVVCKAAKPRQSLIRLAGMVCGGWRLDPMQNLGGRGQYICYSLLCAQRWFKRNKHPVNAPTIQQIQRLIEEYIEVS